MPDALPPPDRAPLQALAAALPDIAARAAARDADAAFPTQDIATLAEAGLLTAPLPRRAGGHGWGTEPHGAQPLTHALRRIGRASLPVGRLYEGHVNALRLIAHHADAATQADAAQDAQAGKLFAVWNTPDPSGPPLALDADGRLRGKKALCSGAGHVTRALVTTLEPGEALPRLVLVALDPAADRHRADLAPWTAQGMRASATGTMDFEALTPLAILGPPGAYTQEPDLSAGAWRFCAVQLGAAEALAAALRDHLRARDRGADPHQAARLAQAAIALESARLWVENAAHRAEHAHPTAIPYVHLARHAVERTCLTLIEAAQRGAGLAAFLRPDPIERISRDLATYLRQPAPDRALAAAAAHILAADAHPGDLWS